MTDFLEDFPAKLRQRVNWIMWRHEWNGTRWTKTPYQRSGYPASVTNPQHWSSFDACLETLRRGGNFTGLGHVFEEGQPVCGIDLDNPFALRPDGTPKFTDPQKIIERHLRIIRDAASFTEVSYGGEGVHIYVEEKVPGGKHPDDTGIEIYGQKRYFAITARSLHSPALAVRPWPGLASLWSELGATNDTREILSHLGNWGGATEPDQMVFDRAHTAINGAKFERLWLGEWQGMYISQSQADQALFDILQFYSKDRLQIVRLFHASELGQRDKAYRSDYITRCLNKSFDLSIPYYGANGEVRWT